MLLIELMGEDTCCFEEAVSARVCCVTGCCCNPVNIANLPLPTATICGQ